MTMITSAEARALVEVSDLVQDKHIKTICTKIRELATLGKSEIVLDWSLPSCPMFTVSDGGQLNAVQRRLVDKLREAPYHFNAGVYRHKSTSRPGLGFGVFDEDEQHESPVEIVTYHIKMTW